MTQAEEPPRPGPDAADPLVEGLYRAGLSVNRVTARWLLQAEIPLLSACVLLTLEPGDAPASASEVAEAIGISVEDATRALHELRSLGYAREHKRRYEPTEAGLRAHAALAAARREAIAKAITGLSHEERHTLARALTAHI